MSIRKPLEFGWVRGGKSSFPVHMGASEVLKAASGRFIVNDASGRGEVAGDGSASLMGFVESGDLTCSTTEGRTELNCIDDVTAVFRIPLRYDGSTYTVNYSTAIDGTMHDLVVVSSIQYANITDADEDLIIIIGGQAATSTTANDGFVYCRMNPDKVNRS